MSDDLTGRLSSGLRQLVDKLAGVEAAIDSNDAIAFVSEAVDLDETLERLSATIGDTRQALKQMVEDIRRLAAEEA